MDAVYQFLLWNIDADNAVQPPLFLLKKEFEHLALLYGARESIIDDGGLGFFGQRVVWT